MYLEKALAEEFYNLILSHDNIVIHRHVRPDPDAIGSQLGLKDMIESKFPNKTVKAAGTVPESLKWLGKMDKVTEQDYDNALVIVTDTANQPRIDGDLYNTGHTLVKIDHHPDTDSYGDLEIVYPQASAACEIIVLISELLADRLPLTKKASRLLYAGLVGDTGRFQYDSTTATTFRVAAVLADQGIDMFEVNDNFSTMSVREARYQGHVMDTMEISPAGVASLTTTIKDLHKFKISEDETNSALPLMGKIEGVLVWVMFIEQESRKDYYYRVRLRSKGPSINQIAEKYDGGGHAKASGAKVFSEEEKDSLLNDLERLCRQYRLENDL